jgi:hypothetical protein
MFFQKFIQILQNRHHGDRDCDLKTLPHHEQSVQRGGEQTDRGPSVLQVSRIRPAERLHGPPISSLTIQKLEWESNFHSLFLAFRLIAMGIWSRTNLLQHIIRLAFLFRLF